MICSMSVSARMCASRVKNVQACRTNFDLLERFLARNIEHAGIFAHFLTHLQQQRGFADARLTADQHKRAVYSAAAENAVEFTDSRMEPAFVSGINILSRVGRDSPAEMYSCRVPPKPASP